LKILTAVISFAVFTLFLAAPPLYALHNGYANIIIPNFWVLFGFISGLTFITVMLILINQQINPGMYAQTFLAATVVKILASLSFTVVFILKNDVNKVVFASDFLYVYFLNTAFEVYVLLRNLRNQNLK
jgi:hypothetical protein